MTSIGTVYLVGAGPGDPGLLTLRGQALLARADAVVYDALANPALLSHCRADCERHFVGKTGPRDGLPRGGAPGTEGAGAPRQEETNALLVTLARAGKTVVRLKGGDPFVFGRGGEEAEALAAAGVPFEVVPGVTAGVAAPAYAGIPITHRGAATSVTFVTGHEDPDKPGSQTDWAALAGVEGTLVLYMGMATLGDVATRLIRAGKPADTQAAVIEWGTLPRQRVVTGVLSDIAERAEATGLSAPAVTVIGAVAGLRDRLAWFDRRPLHGRRIVVTRARAQASEFAATLEDMGAEVIEAPTIRLQPYPDSAAVDRAVAGIEGYRWVVFTSQNAVPLFFGRLAALGGDTRRLGGARVCAIGPATAKALVAYGIVADVVPAAFVAEAAVDAIKNADPGLAGAAVLVPRAEEARDALPDGLTAAGAVVDVVSLYRTEPELSDGGALARRLLEGEVDAVTFTSSSTVKNFVGLVGAEAATCGRYAAAAIGPITTRTARELGIRIDIEAQEFTIPGLVAALTQHLGGPHAP
jgi:uroporphyrinogen III methyltransferase / synthase